MTDTYGNIPISDELGGKDKGSSPSVKQQKKPSVPPPKKPVKVEGRKRYWLIPTLLLLLCIGYYASATMLVPYYFTNKFPGIFQEKTGLALEIGPVKFNPLNNTIILQDVAIVPLTLDGDETDLLRVQSILMDLDLTILANRDLAAESLIVNGAELTIIKNNDSTFNISRFLPQDRLNASPFTSMKELPFEYSLNNIMVNDSRIVFDDIPGKKTHTIDNLQFSFPGFGNFPYETRRYIQPGFSADIDGSPVKLNGENKSSTSVIAEVPQELTLSLLAMDLTNYADYIPMIFPVRVQQGNADINMTIGFKKDPNDTSPFTIDCQFDIRDAQLTTIDKNVSLQTPALRLEGSVKPFGRQIQIDNFLLREPRINLKPSTSSKTFAGLFYEKTTQKEESSSLLQSSPLGIGLLVADNATVIKESKGKKQTWKDIQLSIKNFANTKAVAQSSAQAEQATFRLSGSSANNSSTFSWQGTFVNSSPVGDFEMKKLPLKDLLKLLEPGKNISGKGSATIQGKLKLQQNENRPHSVQFGQGKIDISPLSITRKKRSLLRGSSVSLSPVKIDSGSVSLGNIFIKKGAITLGSNQSSVLVDLFGKNNKVSLEGIDYKGEIIIPQSQKQKPIRIQAAHFQANGLSRKKHENDNFGFSASFGNNGSIKATGKLFGLPFAGNIEIGVTSIPVSSIFAFLPASQLSAAPSAVFNATGVYDLKTHRFEGSAEIIDGNFQNSKKKSSLTFSRAVIDDFIMNAAQKSYEGKKAIFQNLNIVNNGYKLTTAGTEINDFIWKKESIQIDSVDFAQTNILVQPDFSLGISTPGEDNKSTINVGKMHMFGKVATIDQSQQEIDLISDFDLKITPYDANSPENTNLVMRAEFAKQGLLAAEGVFRLSPLQTKLSLELNSVHSTILQHFPSSLSKGGLDAEMTGKVDFSYPDKIVSGSINLGQGNIADHKGKSICSWQETNLNNFTLKDSPFSLVAEKISLTSPQTSFNKANASILVSLQELIATYLQNLNESKAVVVKPKVEVQRVELSQGNIEYSQMGTSQPGKISLDPVSGFINTFHLGTSQDQIDYTFEGKAASGDFTLSGTQLPSSEKHSNSEKLELNSFPMAMLENQLGNLFDLDFANSTLDLSSSKANQGEPDSATITLKAPEPKDTATTAALVLALLADKNDQITATIPLQDNDESLLSAITTYFQKLMIKGTVSPYLLLEQPHVSLQDRDSVIFSPGSSELSVDAENTLLEYGALLTKHPRLMLTLRPTIQRSADTKALFDMLTKAERERVKLENERLLQEWQENQLPTETVSAPDDGIAVQDISEEDLASFTPLTPKEIVITESMLEDLGKTRADAMRQFIQAQQAVLPENISADMDISIIDTLDLPEVSIRLSHLTNND